LKKGTERMQKLIPNLTRRIQEKYKQEKNLLQLPKKTKKRQLNSSAQIGGMQ